MSDWNEQAAPDNNLSAKTYRTAKVRLNKQNKYKTKALNSPQNSK